ncbi:MAG: M56 family metallopeptidase [Verrucomicrobiota bacterium]|nr:M56 family metallopeptidase [Verrucomicrobiota bacterium]
MTDLFVTFLNAAGQTAVVAGLRMTLQATALTALMLALDRALRDRARAALRCGLWMLVVVKFLLPTDLLSPTALAYWIVPQVVSPIRALGSVDQVDGGRAIGSEVPDPVPAATTDFRPTPPQLRWTGGLLLVWVGGSMGFGLWAWARGRAVAQRLRASTEAPEAVRAMLAETAADLGLHGPLPRVLLTDTQQGPALCGLLRPVILLPRGLIEQLDSQALPLVLRHELIHLARRDLGWNLLQVCVQIVWWWHPLVWFANARVRALREAAVDEAVMLEPGSDEYPATLVAVARTCVIPSRMPMAFLGILESGGRLEARIRRLVERPLPRSARLGWVGWVTVLMAGALFLPMGFARRVETPALAALAAKAPTDPKTLPAGGSTASLKPIPAAAAELNSASKVEPAAPDSLRAAASSVVPAIDAPLQVDIQGRFVEIRGSLPPELVGVLSSNRSSVRLTATATRDLIKVFNERDGIDFLTAPRVMTLANRAAEISVSDVRAIDGKNAGPTLQVIPDVSNPAIELSVFASMVQVLGDGSDSNGASETLVRTNLVWARERSWIWDGQSVLIDVGALTHRVRFVDKTVYLGDLPLIGGFFRKEETQDQVSRLFVLVTPTLIDATGRPIHDPAHPPFDPATFPPKP